MNHLQETSSGCTRDLVARSPVGSIERCACGAIHLAIGAVSLRLEPMVFIALSVMVREGVLALEQERAARRAAAS